MFSVNTVPASVTRTGIVARGFTARKSGFSCSPFAMSLGETGHKRARLTRRLSLFLELLTAFGFEFQGDPPSCGLY